jgi:hypothetical protein
MRFMDAENVRQGPRDEANSQRRAFKGGGAIRARIFSRPFRENAPRRAGPRPAARNAQRDCAAGGGLKKLAWHDWLDAERNLVSGLFIMRRKCRTFSMIVAGANCIQIPFGTVLGVFTLLVLLRDSVREAYET